MIDSHTGRTPSDTACVPGLFEIWGQFVVGDNSLGLQELQNGCALRVQSLKGGKQLFEYLLRQFVVHG
jgi:hypothetical protein